MHLQASRKTKRGFLRKRSSGGAFEKRSQFCDLFDCSVVRCDVAEKEGFLFCGKAGSQLFCATGTKFT
ncbi:MAG: hypothetical protein IK057_02070, partial [Clostridia bacterium]|nr:hypothetical protein [Clostridia bacterium]